MTDAATTITTAAADGTAAISLRNLSKRFGEGVLAVDDLSLDVLPGMVFGLLGPNGAGKATVLEMRDVRDLIRRMSEGGATVFLSSHILAELEQICTHAAVMNHGRLVAAGTVDQLIGASQSVYLEVDDMQKTMSLLQATPGVSRI